MADTAFSCTCGTLTGRIVGPIGGAGMHIACHCNSCRCAELVLNQPDPRPAPVHVFQTTPDRVVIDAGADQLAVLRMTDKSKTYRWYAACCNAPLVTTGPGPGFPFASVNVGRITDPAPLGKPKAEAFVPQPGGGTKNKLGFGFVYGFLTRTMAARLSGRWKQTPFFDVATGTPNGPVRVLTSEDRAALPLKG